VIRKIFFFIILLNLINNASASIKNNIIDKFQKIDNLAFNFKQTIDGKDEHGNCVIEYPKKIFCKYNFKYNKILVSNGKSLVIKSDKNKQYYIYPLEKTAFNLILDKKYLLNEMYKSQGKLINNKYYEFKIKDKNYLINIFFDSKNYELVGWQTEDIYQNLVITFVYDLKINAKIKKKKFKLPENN